MGNVKVRKTRHLRQGADANPFPTTEQILTGIATGVVTNLAQRVIDKATDRIAAFAKNRKAGIAVHVRPRDQSEVATPKTAAAVPKTGPRPTPVKAKAKAKAKK